LRPDPNSIRLVPWYPEPTAQVIADCFYHDGTPVEISCRHVLRRVLGLYESKGWEPVVAPELEFFLTKVNEDPDYPLVPPIGRSRRQETARLTWFGHVTGAALPSTDLIDLGGIPYRKTGATTADGRAGFEYALGAHDTLMSSMNYQAVKFERPDTLENDILRGGRILESMTQWRHKISERAAIGADYSFRRALVTGDVEPFNFHTTEAALDYEISQLWSLQGGAGVVYLEPTLLTQAHTGPAWRVNLQRSRAGTTFHVGYLRTFIPSFGYGGTVESQDFGVGFRTPLFHFRRLYLDSSAVFRDNQPLTGVAAVTAPPIGALQQLPLRSLRSTTILGWEPQPWVRLEVFYSLVQQTSLQVGGYIDRNRVGFQIVTSKPMRMQ